MRRNLIYPAGLIVLAAACDGPVPPACGGALSDACRKASDLAYALGIQIADESSDGSPILGDVGTMGGAGKAALSLRVTSIGPSGVRMDGVTARTDRAAASTFPSDRAVATTVSISGAVGAWSGIHVGSTRVGGMDLLGNFVMATSADRGDLHLNGRPSMFGIGVRLGVIQETPSLPAVSLTSMLRFASQFSLETQPIPTDTRDAAVVLKLENGDMNTVDYRISASKKFGAFGFSDGLGRNQYNFDADYSVEGTGGLGFGDQHASLGVTRSNAFIGATYTHKRLTLGAEFGRLTGGDESKTLNVFGEGATAARNYLSVGIRIPAGRSTPK